MTHNRILSGLISLLLGVSIIFVLFFTNIIFHNATPVHAATITVNTLADDNFVNGNCTLREAIIAAGSDAPVDACAAGSGADTINFSVTGTITLSSALPNIFSNIIITGGGTIIVDGGGAVRVFFVQFPGSLTLNSITVQNGSAPQGGGIYNNRGTLTIQNGTVVTSNTTSGPGGGIYSAGTVTVQSGAVVTGNTASGPGGGIYILDSTMTVDNASVTLNTTTVDGGGIYTNNTTLTVQNGAIISNNTAVNGGGIYITFGVMSISNTTISNNTASGNGGGIFSATGSTMNNVLLSGNTAGGSGGGIYSNSFGVAVTNSCIVSNSDTAVTNGIALAMNATNNWWGASSGPGPVGAGDTISGNVNTGGFLTTPPAGCPWSSIRLSGTIFRDDNGNGIQDGVEPGIGGVTITLTGPTNLTTTTAADGSYSFEASAGTYTLTETQPAGYSDGIDTAGNLGGSTAVNDVISNINATTPGAVGTGYNFGEGLPTFSINDVTLAEGNAGPTSFGFTVTLSAAMSTSVTVDYATGAGGTATAGTDYTAVSATTLTFPALTTTLSATVPVIGDLIVEGNETFFVNLSNSTGGPTILDAQGVGNIQNDDSTALSISDVPLLAEGNAGPTNFDFTVTLSAPSALPVTVDYATADNSATIADSDYASTSGTLTIPAGSPSGTITVPVTGDVTVEADEAFYVDLSNPTVATIADGQGVGNIQNDDSTALSISDVTLAEGNAGPTNFDFTVTLFAPSALPVTVDYATADNSATIADSDYASTSGTLTIPAGSLSGTITVPVTGDVTVEADEAFYVDLSNPTVATIADGQGVGNIQNDDSTALSISDVTLAEGNAGPTNFDFTVTLSALSALPVTVDYATGAGGTATAGTDYTAVSATTLTFPALTITLSVTVPVTGDFIAEGNETFFVNLSNPTGGSTILDGQGLGTITNDDTASIDIDVPGPLNLSEAGPGAQTFVFTLGSQPLDTVTVPVSVSSTECTLTGGPIITLDGTNWNTGYTVTVTATDDAVDDGDLACNLVTGDPASTGDALYDAMTAANSPDVSITVIDDDTASIDIDVPGPFNLSEAGPGAQTFVFTLGSQPLDTITVPVSVSSTECTLTGGPTITLDGTNWNTGYTVTVTAIDDAVDDGDLACNLVTGDPASTGDALYDAMTTANSPDVSITVIDDDTASIDIDVPGPLNLSEAGPGAQTFVFTLGSQPLDTVTVPVSVSSTECTLTGGPTITLDGVNWNTGYTVTVTAIDDAVDDGDLACNLVTGDPASTGDALYDAMTAANSPDVSITVIDDDTTGFVVSPTTGLTTNESGGTATFTITLGSQPAGGADVTIPLSSSNTAEGTVPASVTIPNAQWQTGVVITITGVEDPLVDGDIVYTILTGDPTSADPLYDALGAVDVADVSITNQDNDTLPIGDVDVYNTNEDQTLTVDAANGVLNGDTGGNGNPLTAVLDTGTTNGTLTFNADGSFVYVPNPGFFGTDSFTYHPTDGTNNGASVTVTLMVALVNFPPIANDLHLDIGTGTALKINPLNATDPDGDPLQLIDFTQPAHGQVTLVDGRLVYISVPGFAGSDSFTYTLSDGFGGVLVVTVYVEVWLPVPHCADFDRSINDIVYADIPDNTITRGDVFCRVLVENSVFVRESAEIGIPEVLNRGVIQAVDAFGLFHDGTPTAFFNNPVTVCLQGSGTFLYLDATVAPRAVVELPVYMQGGYSCANIPNAGTVVLVNGTASVVNPAPAPAAPSGPTIPLSDCMVTTHNILNLRDAPSASGAVLRMVPYDVTLTAFERTSSWFYVDYLGERGWLSAGYVTPQGTCGP